MIGKPASRLFPLRAAGNRPPLFVLHPSGGSTLGYVHFARQLDPGQPVFGIEADGLDESSAPPLPDAARMIGDYADQVLAAYPAGPYHIAGWSVGGAFAHGLAAELRGRGAEVGLLALIDAFGWVPRDTPPGPDELLIEFAGELAVGSGDPEAEFSAILAALAQTGTAPAGTADFLRRRLAVYTAVMTALRAWRPPRHDVRVELLYAEDGPGARQADFWSTLTTAAVVTHGVPGEHHSMMEPPQVKITAQVVQELLHANR